MVTIERACALPCTEAAADLLTQWIGIFEENRELFAEQTIADAERGDIEAALYADCAREFSAHVAAQFRTILSAIHALA